MKLKGKGGKRGRGFLGNLLRKFVLTIIVLAVLAALGYMGYSYIPYLQERVNDFLNWAEPTIAKVGAIKSALTGVFIIVFIWAISDSLEDKK
ncbi:hypothetical protein M5X00_24285 [Paenibacillus alvei]|uniref:Uncharacterized protein n=1 Tax=Paenibacillus alvei TaxID=44250 RepID=A0ABT4H7E5_PAEAL|nr:hypothetical protein [Paenibacillus alvei]EJW14346.1 hypothetical protein PAV_14c00390 [Paenibacillus alvei DSM 29]MCY9542839.1 hypothetical protein [Paenibacillus alvei]MCY9736106.1 hypothetical protein [Paenibacillus alvei]MCY9757349.1 hypothetical protein [Paenibacillus alvei]MCY9764912.1 hypothetical protein [Paenibacillus alvei]